MLRRLPMLLRGGLRLAALSGAGAAACVACSPASGSASAGVVTAVGAESQYANVISQIGGRYVTVTAIESNPATDPHSFEASPSIARQIASAQLVVQNGIGYDTFMNRIESVQPDQARRVIVVQKLLHLPDSTPNPHVWYSPRTMPAVAKAIAAGLSSLQPVHAAYFRARVARFDSSLKPWLQAITHFRAAHKGVGVAVTEPVGNDMLQAAGATVRTPFALQAGIMNGTDPSPQNVAVQNGLLSGHTVRVLLYNQQVTDSLTQSFLNQARRYNVPVVGLYETMPTPGFTYQSWMLAEMQALTRAVDNRHSTRKL